MPIYEYHNPETGETWDELWSYESHKQFLADNPEIQQNFYAPAMISGVAGVTHKNDSGFNDMLSRIATANPHSPMAQTHGNKGIKESKTREAVNREKARQHARGL